MKKVLIALVGLVVVVVLVMWSVVHFKKSEYTFTDVLPKGASVYVEVQDVPENVDRFISSPLWQNIMAIDFDLLVNEGVIDPQLKVILDTIKQNSQSGRLREMMKGWVGNDVVLAFYPGELFSKLNRLDVKNLNDIGKIIEDVFSGAHLVIRMKPEMKFAEGMMQALKGVGFNADLETEKYNGETITYLKVGGLSFRVGYIRWGDMLVVGFADKAAKDSIDVIKKKTQSLSQDKQYAGVLKKLKHPDTAIMYWDYRSLLVLLENMRDELMIKDFDMQVQQQKQFNDILELLKGYSAFGMSVSWNKDLHVDYHLDFDEGLLESHQRKFYESCRAKNNETLKFVPEDTLVYSWLGCFLADNYWDQLQSEIGKVQGAGSSYNVDQQLAAVETMFGVRVKEDVVDILGDEAGMIISTVDVSTLLQPKFAVFVKIKDKASAQTLLAKMTNQPFLTGQEEDFEGNTIKYFALPLGVPIQPAYGYIDDYLLLASDLGFMKQMMSTSKGRRNALSGSPGFKRVAGGFLEKNIDVEFVNVRAIIQQSRKVLDWVLDRMKDEENKQQAFRSGRQRRLEVLKNELKTVQLTLAESRKELSVVELAIKEEIAVGLSPDANKGRKETLEQKINLLNEEIGEIYRSSEEMQGLVSQDKYAHDVRNARQLLLTEILNPVMSGLETIQAIGAQRTYHKGSLSGKVMLTGE